LTPALLISLIWLMVIALAVRSLRQADAIVVAVAGFGAVLCGFAIVAWAERARWLVPVRDLTRVIQTVRRRGKITPLFAPPPELAALTREVAALVRIAREHAKKLNAPTDAQVDHSADQQEPPSTPSLTFSGLYDAPPGEHGSPSDPKLSGDYSTADMVNRLEPVGFHWIESSPAEQTFLGWPLSELRQRSFLDVLHPDDRLRAGEALRSAISRGEALGLIVRVRTAQARTRAVEVNVGARYGTNQQVSHLRCHLTDVTDKVRADRELRLRTRELTQVNQQLSRINRELEVLKDRYSEKSERLAQANNELSQKNRELDEFAHAVSHDLQEPLRSLLAFSDLLLRDYGDRIDAEGQEYVRYLLDASRRMKAMIQGMLFLSRAGKVIGEFTAVDVEELIGVVKTDLGELFRTTGAELLVVRPLPSVWGDRDRIGQLLSNLISNGIKYNKSPNPTVEIGVVAGREQESAGADPDREHSSEVTIYLTDNGIGIEPQFHASVFQLFRRLHTQDEYPGTGVGLAICSKIVHAHAGRIWVQSAPGQGSTFFVSLRRPPSDRPTAAAGNRYSTASDHEPPGAGGDG
jgi:PAS domain S-box-containing protein